MEIIPPHIDRHGKIHYPTWVTLLAIYLDALVQEFEHTDDTHVVRGQWNSAQLLAQYILDTHDQPVSITWQNTLPKESS
jgi:hypothetical protein